MSGTPENRRDDPERSKGQIPRISAGFIDYLGEREKNKWCPEEDSNELARRLNYGHSLKPYELENHHADHQSDAL